MKKTIYIIIIFLFSYNVSNSQILNVNQIIQEQTEWCWAGVTKCVLDYYGHIHAQCEIAEYTRTVATWHNFGSVNCCTNPNYGCNYWNYNWGSIGSIQDILIHFGSINNYGLNTYMAQNFINTEINAQRPFIARWGWVSGGGHFVVCHGQVGNTIYYMNPWFGEGLKYANYNWFVNDGNHSWTHTNVLTTNPSDIEEQDNQIFNIFPNPSSGQITIETGFLSKQDLTIEVINSLGQIVYTKSMQISEREELNLNLLKGIYFVKIYGDDFRKTEKLIIE